MTGTMRRAGPQVVEMNDLQLLAHLIHMSGLGLNQARALSHSLLDAHQTLERVLALPGDTLLRFPGLGEGAAAFLLLLTGLMARYVSVPCAQIPQLSTQSEAAAFVLPHFQGKANEQVCAFCLGEDYGMYTAAQVTQGGTTEVSCSVPRILKLALTHRSKMVILAHNHPDGSPEFSKSDLLATGIVAQALSTVGIILSDHLLVAGRRILSLRAQALTYQEREPAFAPPQAWLEDRDAWRKTFRFALEQMPREN